MIKFYKNCIINSQYNDLFTQEKLSEYLDTLESFTIQNDFYLYFSGVLKFSLSQPFIYNYANYFEYDTVVNNVNKKYYYIVKRWELINNCLEIEYEIDYWHSFTDWKINRAILINANVKDNTRPSAFPVEYEPQDLQTLAIMPNSMAKRDTIGHYSLVINGYYYTLSTNGEENNILQFCGFVNFPTNNIDNINTSLNNCYAVLTKLIKNQPYANPLMYKITNAYIFPSALFSDNIKTIVEQSNKENVTTKDSTISIFLSNFDTVKVFECEIQYGMYTPYNGKNLYALSYGTPMHQYIIPNDGLKHKIKIQMNMNYNAGFSLILHGINELINIAEDFNANINFDTVDGSILEQRNANYHISMISGVSQSLLGVFGNIKYGQSETPTNLPLTSYSYNYDASGLARAGGQTIEGLNKIIYSQYAKYNAYNPKNACSYTFYNNAVGLATYMYNVTNENEVNDAISLEGYKVSYKINKLPQNTGINYIRCANCNLYGEVPSQVLLIIKYILEKGFYYHV